MYNRGTVYSFI